jgi:integrase
MVKAGTLYWSEVIGGVRFCESLQTSDIDIAQGRRDQKQQHATEKNYAALYQTRTRKPYATIRNVMDAYLKAGQFVTRPRMSTIRENITNLRKVLGACGFSDGDSTAVLTPELLKKYFLHRREAGGDEKTDMRSVSTAVRSVRSIFAEWTKPNYKGLVLPDLEDFMKEKICDNPKKYYEMPDKDLVRRTIGAGRALGADRPELYAVWLLCYDLALRADEAAHCRWSWFEEERMGDGLAVYLRVIKRPGEDWQPKGRGGSVRVPLAVWGDLQRLRIPGELYVLPGAFPNTRRDLVIRSFSGWMRGLGWETGKAAHELRKLKGSFWRSKYGLDRCHDWIRHSSYQITIDYYAALPRYEEPCPMDSDLNHLALRSK